MFSMCCISRCSGDPWRMTFINYITSFWALSLDLANDRPVGGSHKRLASWRIKWSGDG